MHSHHEIKTNTSWENCDWLAMKEHNRYSRNLSEGTLILLSAAILLTDVIKIVITWIVLPIKATNCAILYKGLYWLLSDVIKYLIRTLKWVQKYSLCSYRSSSFNENKCTFLLVFSFWRENMSRWCFSECILTTILIFFLIPQCFD